MGKEKILKVLIASFTSDMPHYVQSLGEDLQANNVSEAAKSAHAIKGVAGNLSTLALAELAKNIETACLDNQPVEEILTYYLPLKECFSVTCSTLNEWLSEHS